MSITNPFAYNTGSTISGTEQFGNIAVGLPTSGFESTGLKWWNGPDQELGYVIAHQSPTGQPGADGEVQYYNFPLDGRTMLFNYNITKSRYGY